MNKDILKTLNIAVHKAGLTLRKHSPEICVAAGIIGGITSTVLACKATTKIGAIIEDKNKQMNDVNVCLNDDTVNYTPEDAQKDTVIIYTQTSVKLLKTYAPSIILGSLSVGSILLGHKILNKRNASLMAAYAVVDKGFKKYRENVIERFGEVVDKELRCNVKQKEVTTEYTDKNGNVKTKTEKVNEIENPLDNISEYARFFDDLNSDQHTKDPEYNLLFLRKQQDYANEKLKCRGYVFLNEVYEMLGIPKSRAGQVVGWVYDKNNDKGDNYIDFGIYDITKSANRKFVNGTEYNILLDFNVDGVIYDKVF